ncbi:MAG: hypothetical protein ACLRNQ_14870 [Flavonifractor plautii]
MSRDSPALPGDHRRGASAGEAFTLICACNGRYYGGGFNPCPDAVPDDGLLDFVVVLSCLQADHSDADRQVRQGGRRGYPADPSAPRPGDARRL